MRIHWLFKYYFAILIILTIIYYIENSNLMYICSNVSEIDIKMQSLKNCMDLKLYNSEYGLNYKKNS